jgi:hypothetical protein
MLAAALLAIASMASTSSQATTISLYAARDNTLIESETGERSNALGTSFFVGRTSEEVDSIRRGLVAFDVAGAIAPGAIIESVTLTLTRTGGRTSASTLAPHRLLADWGEATSFYNGGFGAPSTPGDATWIHSFYDTAAWTNSGGDFSPVASASSFQVSSNVFSWTSPDLTADVQSWLDDPSGNFGWILVGDESSASTSIKFASREHGSIDSRPSLSVVYSTMPEPSTALLLSLGLCGLALVRRRS